MNYRILGRTQLSVSEIGVGCWAIGGPFFNLGVDGGWSDIPEVDARAALLKSVDMGANLFDTADVYGLGKSERLVGWLLRECITMGKRREEFIVVSKTGLFKGCAPHGYHPLQMRHQLEMSLSNLGTEYIDIYFLHHLDFGDNEEYLEEAIYTIKKFQSQGFIKHIGLRGPHHFSFYRKTADDFDTDVVMFSKLADLIKPDVITIRYNMFSRTYDRLESDIFAWAKLHEVGILIYKPLAQGLLIGAFSSDNPPVFQPGDSRRRKIWFHAPALRAIEKRLHYIGNYFGITTTREFVQLCVKYCLTRDDRACVLVGFENEAQVEDAFSSNGVLDAADVAFIRSTLEGLEEEVAEFGDQYFDQRGASEA